MSLHDACDRCRCVPCECPAKPSRRRVNQPLSVTFSDAQIEWLRAQRQDGEPLTAVIRQCVVEAMKGPCAIAHCYKRRSK